MKHGNLAVCHRNLAVCIVALVVAGCSPMDKNPETMAGKSTTTVFDGSTVTLPGESITPVESKNRKAADTMSVMGDQPMAVNDYLEEIIVTAEAAGNRHHRMADYAAMDIPSMAPQPPVGDRYDHFTENGFKLVQDDPVSTFSIDVDTASYANVRRWIKSGQLPPADAIRVEEMINYFHYAYQVPDTGIQPFSITTEMGPSPWNQGRHLLHVGLRGYESLDPPPANLVFLVDTSGSMQAPNKLELVKASLKMLANNMDEEDRISIVVYAGSAGVVLEPTAGSETAKLHRALDQLQAGGSTNGGAGIQLAYHLAEDAFIEGGINRVILATDGDFNVGVTNQNELRKLVEDKRESGVSLTVLGFGQGNYNDAMMQEISQIGNGNAAYIDTMNEARKVLVDEMSSTLETIARDVKIQIEFNPAAVAEYRLVGYESRHLEREDFNNDKVDAGDIGAGHTVTALYEISLAGTENPAMDPLRYGKTERVSTDEVAHIKLRYKQPDEASSQLVSSVLAYDEIHETLGDTSENFRFSVAVASFGQLLKGGQHLADFGYANAIDLAGNARGTDSNGYRAEFINLMKTAQALTSPTTSTRRATTTITSR